jgi:hypothetical protein
MIQITPKGTPTPETPKETIQNTIPRQADTNVAPQGSETTEAPPSTQADPLSPKFALLAKREKGLRSREEQIKAREDALKAKESEYQSGYIPKADFKQLAMEAFKEGELSYDELTQMMLASPNAEVDPVLRQLQQENAELKKRFEELDGSFKQKQTTEYQQAVNQLAVDVKAFVSGKPEYELIDKLDMSAKVRDLIVETFNSDGVLMSQEDACKEIESYLEEEAFKVTSIGKVKAKFTPPEPAKEEKLEQKHPQNQQQLKTLTNAVTTSQPMTARERAILAFQGKLN